VGDELLEIRQLARDFAAAELRPHAERWDAARGMDEDVVPKLAELGFFGMLTPEPDGMGFDLATYLAALEELAWGEPGAALLVAHSVLAADLISRHGSDVLRQEWLAPLAAGEQLGCIAFADDDGTAAAPGEPVRARRTDEGWTFSGRKRWVTNGAAAAVAIVYAATDSGSAFFAVPRTAGYRPGAALPTMGLRSAPLVDLDLDGVVVADAQLLREVAAGSAADEGTAVGVLSAAAIAVGIAQAALEHAVAYAAEREQFGRAIRHFEGIQHKLADMAAAVTAARALVERAAQRPEDAGAAAMAKLTAARGATYVTTEAVQVFGGYGYMRDYPVEKLMRDAQATGIMHGSDDAQRLRIAEALYT
jgi:butyryl-CoA dehydrogenase